MDLIGETIDSLSQKLVNGMSTQVNPSDTALLVDVIAEAVFAGMGVAVELYKHDPDKFAEAANLAEKIDTEVINSLKKKKEDLN